MFHRAILLVVLACSIASAQDIQITTKVEPTARFATHWIFVVDGSSSLWTKQRSNRLVDKMMMAFDRATRMMGDEAYFSVYLFGSKDREKYRDWQPAFPDDIDASKKWIKKRLGNSKDAVGIYSHGKKSIGLALRQLQWPLTVILITDGGFSSYAKHKGFKDVYNEIRSAQDWRNKNGLGFAQICTFGIENRWYYGGGKPADEVCQSMLEKIGTDWRGGYFYIHDREMQ